MEVCAGNASGVHKPRAGMELCAGNACVVHKPRAGMEVCAGNGLILRNFAESVLSPAQNLTQVLPLNLTLPLN